MSKRNLLNLFLLIFILTLVALVVYEPGKDKAITPPTLTNLKVNDINHIKISRHNTKAGEQDVVFEKTNNEWVITKPYQHKANAFRIDSILKLLSAVSLSQNNLENMNQEQFGLIQPQASITFNKTTTIVFGNNKSLKHHRYVKINSTLHMIADTFLYQLTAKAESYINHKLLPEKGKIKKISLPNFKLVQNDEKWEVTPKADNFSADSANKFISEWQLSQAYDLNIVKPQPKTKADISIHLDNDKNIRFKIKNNKDSFNLINIDSGISYTLAKDRRNKLLNLPDREESEQND